MPQLPDWTLRVARPSSWWMLICRVPLVAIHEMIARYIEGYEGLVYGQRVFRAGETWFKRATAWTFYRIMRTLVYKDLPLDSGDFRLISCNCLAGLRQLRETHRFLRGMVAWVGYPQIGVKYTSGPHRGRDQISPPQNGVFCVDSGHIFLGLAVASQHLTRRRCHSSRRRGSRACNLGACAALVRRPRMVIRYRIG